MDVLVIRGAFASPEQLIHLPRFVPEAAVQFRDLSTDGAPTIEGYAREIDIEIQRPTVVVGVSLGGLVAIALRSHFVRRVIALDPPLVSDELPVWLRESLPAFGAPDFLWSIFGLSVDGLERRDYRGLLDAHRPAATILAGSVPNSGLRSGAIAEATLQSLPPWVRTRRLSHVGHDIAEGGGSAIIAALREALEDADNDDQDTSGRAGATGA